MKPDVYVGIDCALEKHDYKIMTQTKAVLGCGTIKNQKRDAKMLVEKLKKIEEHYNITVGIKATNNYQVCLTRYLRSNNFRVVVINPLKTSAYNKIDDYGNKTDSIDASGICNFIIDGKHKNIKQMNQKYLKLRELCRLHLHMEGDLTRTATRLHSRIVIVNPEFTQYFSVNFCKSSLFILENYATPYELSLADPNELQAKLDEFAHGFGKKGTAKRIIALAKESFGVTEDIRGYLVYIKHLIDEYKFLEQKIAQIKREIRAETRKDYCREEIELISSIKGIGKILAAGILSELGDIKNFEKISQIVRFAGMTILKRESGNFVGDSRISKQGSRYLRCYLHQAAMGAKLHNIVFAAVYANRVLKIKHLTGKSRRIENAKIIGCLARRILEAVAHCLMKRRVYNEKIAFDNIELDDFVRETISVQFKQSLAVAACA